MTRMPLLSGFVPMLTLVTLLGTSTLHPVSAAERGRDGELKIQFDQMPAAFNIYMHYGAKEMDAAALVLEPLALIDPLGKLAPRLAQHIPTRENGGISEDNMHISWHLRPGLKWSDGSAVTSEDIRFTWQFCLQAGSECLRRDSLSNIEDVEIIDAQTARIHFKQPELAPYDSFANVLTPILQAAQFHDCMGAAAANCTQQNRFPVGTGPYVVSEFSEDELRLRANPYYRDADKPAFAQLHIRASPDSEAAARSVLVDGENDFALMLQLPPEQLQALRQQGEGQLAVAFSSGLEQVIFNLSDPDPSLGAERSAPQHPHPILSDKRVREAMSLAIDRVALTRMGYGSFGRPSCNLLVTPSYLRSTANDHCLKPNRQRAANLLSAAGWVDRDGDGVREKDGKPLSLLFQAPTNVVRQRYQAQLKAWWEEIGFDIELRHRPARIFFDANPDTTGSYIRFQADLQMFAYFSEIDPRGYLGNWRCDQIPSPQNDWHGRNPWRHCTPQYDEWHKQQRQTMSGTPEYRTLALKMNDWLVQNYIGLPLTQRSVVHAHRTGLKGVRANPWSSTFWNIADWHLATSN